MSEPQSPRCHLLLSRYRDGLATPREIDELLALYEPYLRKYQGILMGRTIAPDGTVYTDDPAVRIFASELHRHGSIAETLARTVEACRSRLSDDEIRLTVVESFLEAIRYIQWKFIFPSRLARNVAGLLGATQYEIRFDDLELGIDLDDFVRVEDVELRDVGLTVEHLCAEYGILLSDFERRLLCSLASDYDTAHAAHALGVSRSYVYHTLTRLARRVEEARTTRGV